MLCSGGLFAGGRMMRGKRRQTFDLLLVLRIAESGEPGVDVGVDAADPHQGRQLPDGLPYGRRDGAEDDEGSSDWRETVSV